ncbi:WD40 repeat-like protein [Coemansia reversa NRRL 1564]|uniref:WD40 repeat-like protein n=1 Tax=Coemansia reversa (strain ATCC 12441 / NRRL 1564) TaxID=763665 RepID=A0A2G5BE68_COERN|nr:WD40 repeat-like protein [Coemansia reversa NRRL 1564]|eukprot:PIA17316.1 WD40 repeat-like protein [Coemansia reversa NRRL 1564]
MVQTFGYISVQPDWAIDVRNALRGVEGAHTFWVSAYMPARQSIHGKIRASTAPAPDASASLVSLDVDADGDISAEYLGPRQLRLSSSTLDIPPALYTSARKTTACPQISRGTGVRGFDISPYGGLLVACGDDGVMDVYETEAGAHRVQLQGHLGDVTCCQFFPSGQVVLSGASDMRLKIWSASDGTNPTTLVGHTATITDLAIVGIGKNVLSAAKDGTVRLWNCGSSLLLHTFALSDAAINRIHLVDKGSHEESELSPNEFETDGKLVAVACEDGRVVVLDLRLKKTIAVFGSAGGLPMRAVAYDIERGLLVAGQSDGSVLIWSDANPEAPPIHSFKRGQSSVSVIRLVRRSSASSLICVGTEDGQLYLASLDITVGAEIVEDLVAFDVDPISQIRAIPTDAPNATRQSIWAAGQDSRVCMF